MMWLYLLFGCKFESGNAKWSVYVIFRGIFYSSTGMHSNLFILIIWRSSAIIILLSLLTSFRWLVQCIGRLPTVVGSHHELLRKLPFSTTVLFIHYFFSCSIGQHLVSCLFWKFLFYFLFHICKVKVYHSPAILANFSGYN